MLYYVFRYLEEHFNLPGAGVFQYISFRAALAVILSLTISLLFGKRLIALLQKKQGAETIRDLGLQGEEKSEVHHQWVDFEHFGRNINSYF